MTAAGLHCDPKKVAAIRDYPAPTNLTELRAFLGLTGYYRKFAHHYAERAAPLTKLLTKGTPFVWCLEQQEAFEAVKAPLLEEPILTCPDHSREFILDTDASNTGIGGVLSQVDEE